MSATQSAEWKKTACIICSLNCGLEVQTEGGRITKTRGDKDHPISQGPSEWTITRTAPTASRRRSVAG
jgi:anaerobic selenocysteine-containing dehydrogenase